MLKVFLRLSYNLNIVEVWIWQNWENLKIWLWKKTINNLWHSNEWIPYMLRETCNYQADFDILSIIWIILVSEKFWYLSTNKKLPRLSYYYYEKIFYFGWKRIFVSRLGARGNVGCKNALFFSRVIVLATSRGEKLESTSLFSLVGR